MSMRLTAEIKHTDKLTDQLRKRKALQSEQVLKSIVLNGQRVLNEAKDLLRTRTPGRTETRYGGAKGGRKVVVSPPGSAPNPDTKRALKSLGMSVDESDMSVRVGTNLVYLAALEFASKRNKRKARPWLRPAFKAWYKKHGKKFKGEMKLRRGK